MPPVTGVGLPIGLDLEHFEAESRPEFQSNVTINYRPPEDDYSEALRPEINLARNINDETKLSEESDEVVATVIRQDTDSRRLDSNSVTPLPSMFSAPASRSSPFSAPATPLKRKYPSQRLYYDEPLENQIKRSRQRLSPTNQRGHQQYTERPLEDSFGSNSDVSNSLYSSTTDAHLPPSLRSDESSSQMAREADNEDAIDVVVDLDRRDALSAHNVKSMLLQCSQRSTAVIVNTTCIAISMRPRDLPFLSLLSKQAPRCSIKLGLSNHKGTLSSEAHGKR